MSQYVTTPDGKRHAFPDEATPEQIRAALSEYSGPQPIMSPQVNPATQFLEAMKRHATGALPMAGGLAGGIAGAPAGLPGMVYGAAIGGGAGEAARQGLQGEKINPMGIAHEAAGQGLLEAGGGALAWGAQAAARPIMKNALRASKAIQRDFPDLVETVIGKRLSASKGGLQKATKLRKESAAVTGGMVSRAEKSGVRFDPYKVASRADDLLKNKALPNADADAISREIADFVSQHKGQIEPTVLQEIKQIYQSRSVPMYAADAAGKKAAAMSPVGQFNKAIARGAREQLGTIPGVAAQDAKTQSLIGAERAIRDATMRHHGRFEVMKPGTYPLVGALGSHAVTSRVALFLTHPAFQALSRQSPRLAAELLHQSMYPAAEADATSGE